MAVTVVLSGIVEGSSYEGEGNACLRQTDVFMVEGLTEDARAAYVEACCASGLPAAWSTHPYVSGINAVQYTAKLLGKTVEHGATKNRALVYVTYVNSQPQFIKRGGCGLYQTTTDMDRFRNVIQVTNRGSTLGGTTVTSGTETWQTAQVTVSAPDRVVVIERVRATPSFDTSHGVIPEIHANDFGGKLNNATFFGYPAGHVLCESVNYDNAGFGSIANRYQYEFRFRDYGWQPEVAWTNPKTGKPPTDLLKAPNFDSNKPSDPGQTAAYGRKVVNWFDDQTADFNLLLA